MKARRVRRPIQQSRPEVMVFQDRMLGMGKLAVIANGLGDKEQEIKKFQGCFCDFGKDN